MNDHARRILDGDVRAAARLMRLVDDDVPEAREILDALFPHTGHAHIVGFTGNPGSGKSTLVDQFVAECRQRDETVGCVVIDPTSPFSGGAILGDRIRMNRHTTDPGVFIRSVATRGNLGGISRSTPAMIEILDAMGFDWIVVETVGVGQDEVDVAAFADSCIVVTIPGLGDEIQAAKAGILEVADVFVVNKNDRPGADAVARELQAMLHLAPADDDEAWTVPILRTVATTGDGVEALYETVQEHRGWEHASEARRAATMRARYERLIELIARGWLRRKVDQAYRSDDWAEIIADVVDRRLSPRDAADRLLDVIR